MAAEENPTSHVVGTDLSAIQPREYEAANCRFEVDDAEEEWLNYPMFDYVHVRLVCTCFNDHRVVMKNIFDNLNSGGWVEYQDYDMEFLQANPDYEGTAVVRWSQALIRGLANKGRDLLVPRRYKSMMIEAGCKHYRRNCQTLEA